MDIVQSLRITDRLPYHRTAKPNLVSLDHQQRAEATKGPQAVEASVVVAAVTEDLLRPATDAKSLSITFVTSKPL